MNEDDVLVESNLDGTVDDIFGWRFHDGGSNGLVTIYVEDDEQWFPKMTFDVYWLPSFVKMANAVGTARLPELQGEQD